MCSFVNMASSSSIDAKLIVSFTANFMLNSHFSLAIISITVR